VQGVCADCWGVKDPDVALDFRSPRKTEPLLDLGGDLDDLFELAPWLVVSGVILVAAIVAVVLRAVLRRAFGSRRFGAIR
jgi:hypothetical protein